MGWNTSKQVLSIFALIFFFIFLSKFSDKIKNGALLDKSHEIQAFHDTQLLENKMLLLFRD